MRPSMRIAPSLLRISGLALLVATSACDNQTLVAAAPRARANAAPVTPLPPLGMSVVDAPISYALTPLLDALERAVPRKFGDINHRMVIASNTRQQVAFEAVRTPFHVEFDGKQVVLSSIVSYQGRGWYKPPLAPTVSASCGTTGPQPRVHIVLAIDADFTAEWSLRTRSRVRTIRAESDTPRDACKVTMFHLDVTDRVLKAIRPQIEERLPGVDRGIAAFDIRSRMDRWYNLLNKSIHIHDSLWLVLAPQEVRLGKLHMSDSALVVDIRLYARPVMESGPRPPRIHTPLPPLTRAVRDVGDSAHLRLEGRLAYEDANAVLSAQLVGRSISRYGRSVKVARIRVYPLSDGRIVLAVGVTGDIVGDAYLVGTPSVDSVTHTISVPDLDFDVNTANALVRGLAWLRKADLVAQLRENARWPLDGVIDAGRKQVEEALNRELAPGIRLTGHIQTGHIVGVAVLPRYLMVRADATGSLGLTLDREIESSDDDHPRTSRRKR